MIVQTLDRVLYGILSGSEHHPCRKAATEQSDVPKTVER